MKKELGLVVKPNPIGVLEYKRLKVALSNLPNHIKKEKYTEIYKLEKEYIRMQRIERNAKSYLNGVEANILRD
jgi:hypothetical protein